MKLHTTTWQGGAALLALAAAAGAQTPANTNIDVLAVYTPGASALYPGGINTRIQHIFNVANQAYADSEVGITLRLVQSLPVSYSDTVGCSTALSTFVQNRAPSFSSIETWRTQYGADMALLLRPYVGDGVAGIAYLGGMGQAGNMSNSKSWMYSHVSINCEDYVLAHELGHNMGLVHSRKQDPAGGTWSYSAGYGLQGVLVDVMAYSSAFGTDNLHKVYQFSNPRHSFNGHVLGVASSDAVNGADASTSLNATRNAIAGFYPSKLYLSGRVGEFGGDGRADLLRCDPDDGASYLWITGTSSAPASGLGASVGVALDPAYTLAAVGDFDGDGDSDALLRNAEGFDRGWIFDSGTPSQVSYPTLAGAYWQVAGTGDLDGDGKDDIVWRNYWDGTNRVWLMNGGGAPVSVAFTAVADLKWRIDAVGDFDGDGKKDLFWRNYTNGKTSVWLMNGGTVRSTALSTTVADLNWKGVGSGDFDGDGHDDVVFQNTSTAACSLWYMNGSVLVRSAALPAQPSTAWRVAGVGDFDADGLRDDIVWNEPSSEEDVVWTMTSGQPVSGLSLKTGRDQLDSIAALGDLDGDHKADLVWRNSGSGVDRVWKMNGAQVTQQSTDALAGSLLRIAGTGDFNGDGRKDLLWRDATSGLVKIWLMNGNSVLSKTDLTTVADAKNVIAGIGDLNGDGKDDVVLRHSLTGVDTLWTMNGAAIQASAALPLLADLNWKLGGVADMNGDGKADLVWRNGATGNNAVWLMNGAVRAGTASLTALADLNWKLCAVADFNADGKKDLLWRHGTTGKNAIWFLNGTTFQSSSLTTVLSDTNWVVEGVDDFDADGKADILWRNNSTLARSVWLMNGATLASSSSIY